MSWPNIWTNSSNSFPLWICEQAWTDRSLSLLQKKMIYPVDLRRKNPRETKPSQVRRKTQLLSVWVFHLLHPFLFQMYQMPAQQTIRPYSHSSQFNNNHQSNPFLLLLSFQSQLPISYQAMDIKNKYKTDLFKVSSNQSQNMNKSLVLLSNKNQYRSLNHDSLRNQLTKRPKKAKRINLDVLRAVDFLMKNHKTSPSR